MAQDYDYDVEPYLKLFGIHYSETLVPLSQSEWFI